jgi:energy-coupling factor transport system ATP-binding protein
VAFAIEIVDYSWAYAHGTGQSLKRLNLSVRQGECVGIIGPNGAGKTTLAYSIDGLVPGQYHGVKQGSVTIHGREVEDYARGMLQREVGLVFSDPEAQFTAMTVEDELVFGLENLGLDVPEIRERLEWVTELTGLGPLLEKPPYEISGGQKQRVALAAVLAMHPRVLVLDEPTSMLDPISRKRVFEVLGELRKIRNTTLILIEHGLEHVVPLADRMILLAQGELLLDAATPQFFEHLELLETHGIHTPGAVEVVSRLKHEGRYGGELPRGVDDAVPILQSLLDGAIARETH